MSYEGPAVIIVGDQEIAADVRLRADTSSPIKSWGGSGTATIDTSPEIVLDKAVIRLPGGREADAFIDVAWHSGAQKADLEIRGSGKPPFDVGPTR